MRGFAQTINQYRESGVQLAIDDFGAGHSGLNLLADFQPDVIKMICIWSAKSKAGPAAGDRGQ